MARQGAIRLVRTEQAEQRDLWPRAISPVELKPIEWGSRDKALGRLICQHVEDATPPIEVRFNPLTHQRVRRVLRSIGVGH